MPQSFFVTNSIMSKTLKAIVISIYCAIFLHSLKYLLLHRNEEIIELNYLLRTPGLVKKIRQELKKYRGNSTLMTLDFKQPRRFPTDLKFILIWNNAYDHPNQVIRQGQDVFLYHNCTYFNCFITSNKDYLIDLRYFDAILFNEESHYDVHPPYRATYQKYVFTADDSGKFYPICNQEYQNYFNMTWTYRLDSDIPRPFIAILDKYGKVVGPKINMTWVSPMKSVAKETMEKIRKKNKAVAWFKSYCVSETLDETQALARSLNESLMKNNLRLDVYGWCGNKKCPKGRIEECLTVLRKEYYFYLAFESSFSEDYVSEKILYPLQNYAVPIVFGGADYSRFLPPGSYIDAGKLGLDKVVPLIIEAIKNKDVYSEYFRWHNHYTYKEVTRGEGVCNLCEFLNDPRHQRTAVENFGKWWNHRYNAQC